ncbi:MAG: hypothetical protein OSJ24_04850 [Muribaculaceae bacterium]|nr:hypothetical protein [Muribaculaceae bacterium]
MAEISTPILSARAETPASASPRQLTIAFIKQFARAYSPAAGGIILN